MTSKSKPKPVGFIKINIFEDGKFDTTQKCNDGHEQMFASLLTSMSTGNIQEFVIQKMIDDNPLDKDKVQNIYNMYVTLLNQITLKVQQKVRSATPVVRPTEIFGSPSSRKRVSRKRK